MNIRIYENTGESLVWTGVTIASTISIEKAIQDHSLENMNRSFVAAEVDRSGKITHVIVAATNGQLTHARAVPKC